MTLSKDEFIALLDPMAQSLASVDPSGPGAAAQCRKVLPFSGTQVGAVRSAAVAAIDSDWLLPKENGGVRFGRVSKDLHGFSVDAVLMNGPGPKHRHPNGELDLCFALDGKPTFDGHNEGWVVYPPESVHVPTVAEGQMLILYFLPGGAIEFM